MLLYIIKRVIFMNAIYYIGFTFLTNKKVVNYQKIL